MSLVRFEVSDLVRNEDSCEQADDELED